MATKPEGHLVSLLAATAAAGLVELLLLRLATRTFVNIPGLDSLRPALAVVAETGRLAYYLTVLLAVAALAVVVASAGRVGVLTAGAVAVYLVAAGSARAGVLPDPALGWATVVVVAVLGLGGRRRRPAVPLLALAAVAGWLAVLAQAPGGLAPGLVNALTLASETAAVTGLVLAPLLVGGRFRRGSVAAGGAAGLLAALALAPPASPLPILALWSFGIAGALPAWVHGIAAGFAVATLSEAVARRQHPVWAGLALVIAGGFAPASSYQSALLVLGLVALALPARPAPPASVGTAPAPEAVAV